MILIKNIHCTIDVELNTAIIAKKIQAKPSYINSWSIVKKSLDARESTPFYVYSVAVTILNENKYLKLKDVSLYEEKKVEDIIVNNPTTQPLVVGFGPSGMFAALAMAKAGLKPIIIERGSSMEDRIEDVEQFLQYGKLNKESNVLYGEGGAGTFSDGKLTTRIKDDRIHVIIDELVEAGANPSIRYESYPHVGTDALREIVKNIRLKIIRLGGSFQFNTKMQSLLINNNRCIGIIANDKEIHSDCVLLCLGHSASDTYHILYNQQLTMEPKDFAIGARIEHLQSWVNTTQHKEFASQLPPAEYRLAQTAKNGRGVYTFCMCPGGIVMASQSEENSISVNGMSYSQRDLTNANSALLCQIKVADFYKNHPLDGFEFQKKLENEAFLLGGSNYQAPAQRVIDYLNNTPSTGCRNIQPSYQLNVHYTDLNTLFPSYVNEAFHEILPLFNKKMPGFINEDSILTAIETRSSSPIKIPRDINFQSKSIKNVYPCGEGAGYSGGIMSSALDGYKVALSIIHEMSNQTK